MIRLTILFIFIALVSSLVVPFDKNVVDHVLKERNPCIFLLTTPNETSNAAKKAFYEFAEEND